MPFHDIVVIGGSAGSLPALRLIVEALPATLKASVLVVMHTRTANGNGLMPNILNRHSALPVAFATNREKVVAGRILLARPDFHLLVTKDGVRTVHGPRENGFRPAIDPLFRTAAREYGPRVVGIVLSGGLSDGSYGLAAIKHRGGIAIVQHPDDAIIPSMPLHAIDAVAVDYVLRTSEIADTIVRLAETPIPGEHDMPRLTEPEPQLLMAHTNEVNGMERIYGSASSLTCPDCGGALWEVERDGVLRFQCHVGHQYAPENLDEGQRDAIDSALWSAVRALEEHVELKARMARRAGSRGLNTVASGFEEGARDAHRQAQLIRAVLASMDETRPNPAVRAEAADSPQESAAARGGVKSSRRKKPAARPGTRRMRRG